MFFLSVFDLLRQPLYQVAFFLVITTLSVPFLRARSANAIWNVAGVLYVGFMIANTVFFFFEDAIWKYFFISLVSSLVYVLIAGMLVSFFVSALKKTGSGESAMIFVSIIYHPVILLLMILLKWIVRSV
jgi:hypothetical protein